MDGTKLIIVGGGSGIGRQIATDAAARGAEVILTGRDKRELDAITVAEGISTALLDLADEESISRLAAEVGELDYLVSLAAAPANGPVTELDRDAIHTAFDAKVIGPILLAKHFGPRFGEGGAMLLFAGVVAWRPAPERVVMATTNGAVATLAQALAVELAPIRVNALSPGIVDSGAWDRLGAGKDTFFAGVAATNPARRVGHPEDLSSAALLALTNPYITGTTLHVDGGGRLA